ncbi:MULTISPECIES: hypothetical protein [unclassified Janthinobacterium]|uniref:hypothetical protein n=1 Tax=unclassified Janthinobacterium TaxID=2610881 RepID=UPI0016198828|nr:MULTISPECIES: hypothetical protein [unclassified Janthinobacterium]MBB5368054.1 hypothetical protein [Janthinobacterium sp. K2C7]MBB5379468.1 hypothetical protein [Janthinobacterium sp. K2Li3]MBB5386436.1 hypothetical protein [Janthinobacterium sp. K2E3]
MPKNKRPVPRKSANSPEDKDEAVTRMLCTMALNLAEQEDRESQGTVLAEQAVEFGRIIRKNLNQKKDEVLYDAIERSKYEDVGAYQYLRQHIEEASSVVVIRRENAASMEINAFVVPLLVQSTGGLKQADTFLDQSAFEALVKSFQQAELESAKAKVVLMSHAYDLDEIDRITYSHLHEMVRDAYTSMTDKKIVAAPGLERSIVGWSETAFGPQDTAVELRFLLGFALKRVDDPFYVEPKDEAALDAWFDARMARYQQWTSDMAELVKRCLAPAGTALEVSFLYQDLFHGGKEQGMAEYAMLQMMSGINHALAENNAAPADVSVIVGPADEHGEMLLRVNVHAAGGALLHSADKPLDLAADLQDEVDDICDALATIGVSQLSVALRFDAKGQPLEVQAYSPA